MTDCDSVRVVDRELAAKAPDRIAGMFDAIAARYDLLNRLLSAGLDRRWRSRAVQALELTGVETVLDVCTGTGDLAIAAVSGAGQGARRVIGVDFAAQMLRVGSRKVQARHCPVTLVQGDAMTLPLSSEAVDAVTIGFGIRNVVSLEGACAEVLRVLRPGGRLAVLEFGLPRTPGLRTAYLWYFRQVLPRIGALISSHRQAYSYLPDSVGTFPAGKAFSRRLEDAGFTEVRHVQLALGIVYLYVARKPRPPS